MRLTIDNLKEVRACLHSVRRKWYNIGIELGLKVDELDTISAKHNADHGECLIEMIKLWLKSIDPMPTWTALGDALRSAPIDEVEQSIKAYREAGGEQIPNKNGANRQAGPGVPVRHEDAELSDKNGQDDCDAMEANFPFLRVNIKDLTKEEKTELLFRLSDESKAILNSFARLVTHTQMHLRRSNTAADDLRTLFREGEIEELADQINPADTIPEIWAKIKDGKYWSFFNYELLVNIINCFCTGTPLFAELNGYLSEFKIYCQRRVSEVPRGSLRGEHVVQQSMSIFKVKTDEKFSIEKSNLQTVKNMQLQLEKILNKKPILLFDVEGGCIEITFRYFNDLSPLKERKKAALAKIGVKWLRCFKLVKPETGTTQSTATASAPVWKPTQSSSRPRDETRINLPAHAIEVGTPEDQDVSVEIRKPISGRSSSSSVSFGSQEVNMAPQHLVSEMTPLLSADSSCEQSSRQKKGRQNKGRQNKGRQNKGQRNTKSFKQRISFASRKDETDQIRSKYPQKVPVIVERSSKEKELPLLDNTKFLVPGELTMSQFTTLIRGRMELNHTQAFYLWINGRSLASMSTSMDEIYNQERDEDGFLYMVYSAQLFFG